MTPLSYIGRALGENFDVNINILNAIDLRECHFLIHYDASSLDAIQVNPGSFFPPEPSFEVTKDPNQGFLDVAVFQESYVPLLWNGSILSVIFNVTEAPSSGVSSIRFEDVELWNTESESIDFQHSNALFVWITSGNSPADRSIDLYSQRGGIGADEVGGVFLGIGHIPNTEILKGITKVDEQGYAITYPDSTKTDLDGLFVCGDAQDSIYRQAITAAGTGCMAALETERYLESLES